MEDIQIQKDLISIYLSQLLNDPDEVIKLAMKAKDEEINLLRKEIRELKEEVQGLKQYIDQVISPLTITSSDLSSIECISNNVKYIDDQYIDQSSGKTFYDSTFHTLSRK